MTNPNPDVLEWLDTLIKADEADVLEVLENALWQISNHAEGEATLSTDELKERIRKAIARMKGQALDKEIEERLRE